jgi:hypothetical protein
VSHSWGACMCPRLRLTGWLTAAAGSAVCTLCTMSEALKLVMHKRRSNAIVQAAASTTFVNAPALRTDQFRCRLFNCECITVVGICVYVCVVCCVYACSLTSWALRGSGQASTGRVAPHVTGPAAWTCTHTTRSRSRRHQRHVPKSVCAWRVCVCVRFHSIHTFVQVEMPVREDMHVGFVAFTA